MAEDEWAHIVLIAALSFTDDTALLKKSIVPELLVQLLLSAIVGSPGHTPFKFALHQSAMLPASAPMLMGECLCGTNRECRLWPVSFT